MGTQVGELYVDIGVRGLSQAQRALAVMGEQVRQTGRAGGGAFSSMLGGLRSVAAGGAAAVGSLAALATTVAAGAAGLAGLAAAGVYALSELGRAEDAGASLKSVTASVDQLTETVRIIAMEFGELVARVFGVSDGVDQVSGALQSWWETWQPTILAALDVVKMVVDTAWSVISSVIDVISQAFSSLFDALGFQLGDSGQSWAETVRGWLESVLFFAENWRLYLEYAWEQLKLFASNSWERLKAFGQNIVIILQWVWDNWRDIFTTIGDYITTVFSNAIENLKRLWKGVTDFLAGKEFNVNLKPLTEGFKSSVKEMPQFVEAKVRDATDRMLQITDELTRKRAAFQQKRDERTRNMLADLRQPPAADAASAAAAKSTDRFGFVGFADLARQQQESRLQALAERQARAAEQAAAGIMGLADLARGPGIKVQQMGGAVFG